MVNITQKNNYLEKIILELQNNAKYIDLSEIEHFGKKIIEANHIFLAGAGRSGIAIQAFANRLMHLGFSVSLVGEITSPHSQVGDLLIICSGSGETGALKNLATNAKQSGVNIALITMKKKSTIGELADLIVVLPGQSKDANVRNNRDFSQPMGTSFEQLAFLTFDSLVLTLMDLTFETSETMFNRHADFE